MTFLLAALMAPKLAGVAGGILSLLFLALGQVGDGGGAAPAAPAAAPAEGGSESAAGAPAAPAKARTIDDDLEDVIKKHGGYEYAKGKKLDSAQNLKRMLGRVGGVDSAAEAALKKTQEADGLKAKLSKVAELPPRERAKALEELGIPKKVWREALEEDLLAEDARYKAEQGMTERERQLAREAEDTKAELEGLRGEKTKAEAAEKERQFLAESDQMYGQMVDAATKAFDLAGFPKGSPELVLAVMNPLAERIDRAKKLGLDVDPVELAEVAIAERSKISNDWNAARPLEDLSASLEAIQTTEEDPHRPGQKMNRLRQLMVHEAAKIRAKVTGGNPAPAQQQRPVAQNGDSRSMADKMAAARTFGSDKRTGGIF